MNKEEITKQVSLAKAQVLNDMLAINRKAARLGYKIRQKDIREYAKNNNIKI